MSTEIDSAKAEKAAKRYDSMLERHRFEQMLHETFEILGGVPRLVDWANESPDNYKEFIKIAAKLIPKEKKVQTETVSIIYKPSDPL